MKPWNSKEIKREWKKWKKINWRNWKERSDLYVTWTKTKTALSRDPTYSTSHRGFRPRRSFFISRYRCVGCATTDCNGSTDIRSNLLNYTSRKSSSLYFVLSFFFSLFTQLSIMFVIGKVAEKVERDNEAFIRPDKPSGQFNFFLLFFSFKKIYLNSTHYLKHIFFLSFSK